MDSGKCVHFTEAYKEWTGSKWEWKNVDGSPNHPMESKDPKVVAFYLGFRYAKKVSVKAEKIVEELPQIKRRLKEIEDQFKTFRKVS